MQRFFVKVWDRLKNLISAVFIRVILERLWIESINNGINLKEFGITIREKLLKGC
jgi:hypothetical protein